MTIVELGDYTVSVMRDSEDPPWLNLMSFYKSAIKNNCNITILTPSMETSQKAASYVYSGRRLILFFENKVNEAFKVGSKVLFRTFY